jgi:hypothetical protein
MCGTPNSSRFFLIRKLSVFCPCSLIEPEANGSALLVVYHVKDSFLLRLARNAPKRHYPRLYRPGVVVFVVAQPIQDLS